MHRRIKRGTTPFSRAAPRGGRPRTVQTYRTAQTPPDGGGKTDDCAGHGAGAMNRSTSPLKRLPAPAAKAALWLSASAPYRLRGHRM